MADHYYSARPTSEHHLQEIQLELRGVQLKFITDTGVFSKNRIDNGTKLLIEALPLDSQMKEIFDLACGYGPIGLVVAKLLPGATIYMSDINERAVDLARQNAAINQIQNVIIESGQGFKPFQGRKFDLIVTNPPIRAGKEVIYPLVDEAYNSLHTGGFFTAVIMTKQGAKSLERKMEAIFGNVSEWEKGSGYRVVASKKHN